MAPKPVHPSVQSQLLRLLIDARRRGEPFEAAWQQSVHPGKIWMTNMTDAPPTAVRWPSDRSQRRDEIDAIVGSKGGWRRAYNRDPPTRPEAALTVLLPMLEDLFDRDRELRVTTRESLAA